MRSILVSKIFIIFTVSYALNSPRPFLGSFWLFITFLSTFSIYILSTHHKYQPSPITNSSKQRDSIPNPPMNQPPRSHSSPNQRKYSRIWNHTLPLIPAASPIYLVEKKWQLSPSKPFPISNNNKIPHTANTITRTQQIKNNNNKK